MASNMTIAENRKVGIFSKLYNVILIQTNVLKMSVSIDKQIDVVIKQVKKRELVKEIKILRDIIFLKHQYNIMQRNIYKLKTGYTPDIVKKICSSDKLDRLYVIDKLIKLEYIRIDKKNDKENIYEKYKMVLDDICTSIEKEIIYETKISKYTNICEVGTELDKLVRHEEDYTKIKDEFMKNIYAYVAFVQKSVNEKDLSQNEKELVKYIEDNKNNKQIKHDKIEKMLYEFTVLYYTNMFAYRYFTVTDCLALEIKRVSEDKLLLEIIDFEEYMENIKYVYDLQMKSKVNDMNRNIESENRYYEYRCMVNVSIEDGNENSLTKYIIENELNENKKEEIKIMLEDKLMDLIELEHEDDEFDNENMETEIIELNI